MPFFFLFRFSFIVTGIFVVFVSFTWHFHTLAVTLSPGLSVSLGPVLRENGVSSCVSGIPSCVRGYKMTLHLVWFWMQPLRPNCESNDGQSGVYTSWNSQSWQTAIQMPFSPSIVWHSTALWSDLFHLPAPHDICWKYSARESFHFCLYRWQKGLLRSFKHSSSNPSQPLSGIVFPSSFLFFASPSSSSPSYNFPLYKKDMKRRRRRWSDSKIYRLGLLCRLCR